MLCANVEWQTHSRVSCPLARARVERSKGLGPQYPAKSEASVTGVTTDGHGSHTSPETQEQEIEPAARTDNGSKGYDLLLDLVARIATEAKAGLHPKGHLDCQWGVRYPAQYMGALDYLSQNRHDEEGAFVELSALVYKIQAEAIRGTPLTSNSGEWI